jgi:hypothetical protein
MPWRTPTDAQIGAPIGTRIDVAGVVVDMIDAAGRREAAA